MEYTRPPFLKKGDSIRIVAPAGRVPEPPVRFAKNVLEQRGYSVSLGKHLFDGHHQFSANDRDRADDLQQALDDPSVKAILCARGGYGSTRILDRINWTGFSGSPKWLCGYSDITAIHARCAKLGISSLHGTMPVNFETNSPDAIDSLINALTGNKNSYSWESPGIDDYELEGILLGGNLSVIYSLLGSEDQPDYKNAVLFLEDLNEYMYHMDRMLVAMKRAGVFSKIKGVLLGDITEKPNDTPFGSDVRDVLSQLLGECPVITGVPAGHIHDNRCLILGQTVKLQVRKNVCTFLQDPTVP